VEWVLRPVCLLHENKKKSGKERHLQIKDWNIRPRRGWQNNIKMSVREMGWDGMD
jgi:hypothetical protein